MGVVGPCPASGSRGQRRIARFLPHRRWVGDAAGSGVLVPALGVVRRQIPPGGLLRRARSDLPSPVCRVWLAAAPAVTVDPGRWGSAGTGGDRHGVGFPVPGLGPADLFGLGLLVRGRVHADVLDELLLPRVVGALPDALPAGGGPIQLGCFEDGEIRHGSHSILAPLALEGSVGDHLFLRRGGQAQHRLDGRCLSGSDLPRETVGDVAPEVPLALRLGGNDRAVGSFFGAGSGRELARGGL